MMSSVRFRRDINDPNLATDRPVPFTTLSSAPPYNGGTPKGVITDEKPNGSSTDTVAALTIALLAVVIVISSIIICRAIKKRRQAQRGRELNAVPTVSTGVMGTGVSAFGNVNIAGQVTWESVESGQREITPPVDSLSLSDGANRHI